MIIFMSMAMVVVIALLIMVLFQHESMKKYDTKKADLLKKINKIFNQTYVPVKVNVARIERDIVGYEKETKKINEKFGHPYALALKSFAEAVGISLEEFKAKFGEFWEEQKGRTTRDLIFRRYKVRQFSEDFPNHKSTWTEAMEAFMREAQKVTLEEINASNADGIFLAAMGKGRRFSDSPARCQAFMKRMRFKMIEYFDKKKVNCITTNFSFDDEQLPSAEDIDRIAAAWEIVSDLAKRIADAKVDEKKDALELVEFSKRGLYGEKDGDYTMYRFNFTINGDLASIRRIVQKLYEAYEENRIYAIRDIKLTRVVDRVNNILAESERVKEELDYDIANGEKKDDLHSGSSGRSSENRLSLSPRIDQRLTTHKPDGDLKERKTFKVKPAEKEEKKILGPKDVGYAMVIVGSNNICRAEFEVDYIIFDNASNN